MKSTFLKSLLTLSLALGVWSQANAAIYSAGNVNGSGTSLNLAIPDGSFSGISSQLTVSGENFSLSSLTVTLNISGGYNGDLYGYLSYNGTLVTLLNRVGTGGGDVFGYATSGFNNVTLADGSASNIHNVATPGSGISYSADGGSLASFNNMDPNGTWTVFFADMSGGGGTSVLNGWSLNVTAVPEPVNVALGIFASIGGLISLIRSQRLKKLTASK